MNKMALEIALKYSRRSGVRKTGRKMLTDLAEKLTRQLKCESDRDVKIALLKLRVFVTPGQSHLQPGGEWIDSMDTPINLLGIGFSEGLREELKSVFAWRIMDEIEALPNSRRSSNN